jgi:hypothetical protein
MNWDAISAIGEIIGAVAVVITLGYLAVQISQNTNQLKGESIREINNTEMELTRALRDDHDLFVLLMRSLTNWNDLKPQEQGRAHLYIHAYTRWIETCWNLYKQKALEERIYNSREVFILGLLSRPEGGRVWWHMWKSTFDPDFVAQLDRRFVELGDDIPFLMDVPFYAPEHWQESAK